MRTIIVALTVLMAAASWAVTVEDIAKQAAVVAAQQAVLDSMTSQSHADALQATVDADSTLATNSVRILVASVRVESGVRDPEYVCVDVPRGKWGALAQRMWDFEVRSLPVIATAIPGRYLVHRVRVPAVLTATASFITSTTLGE